MNKATELTEDELAKLKGYMHKTPVEVEGNEEVKYLVHGAKDLEIDHDVWPIAEGGDIVNSEAGRPQVQGGRRGLRDSFDR